MSIWRLDEVHGEEEGGLIADLDIVPGDPDTHRRIQRLEGQVAAQPGVWQNRIALARSFAQDGRFDDAVRTGSPWLARLRRTAASTTPCSS
jgi:hypothetical protein